MLLQQIVSSAALLFVLLVAQPLHAFDLPAFVKSRHLQEPSAVTRHTKNTSTQPDPAKSDLRDHADTKNILLKKYHSWKGVKYRWGGDSRHGIDCSAFTRRVFKELSVHLPRTTAEQIRSGDKITKQQLQVGDLVFFKTTRRVRHVGIYVGNDQFIHASRKTGVTTSSLNNDYWVKRYETSVRVIG